MRHFIVIGHDVPLDGEFSLDDIAGEAGRLDVLCRCVSAAVFLSHDIRDNVQVWLILQNSVTIHIDSENLKYMHPDERNIAALLRDALQAKSDAIGHQEVTSSPGIHVSKRGLEPILSSLPADQPVVQLHHEGTPLPEWHHQTPIVVVSDHKDFTNTEQSILQSHRDEKLSVSPQTLHANHAITVMQNYIDTQYYTTY
ncbi:MAG: tRNA (pseudouridine(54)-N(1))-methyltransferase TrmY [Halobacteriaceae archaeon]